MKRIFGVLAALMFCVSMVQAQSPDSLIIGCAAQYAENTTHYIPVYARVANVGGYGLTAGSLMFWCDITGLSIVSVRWDGVAIGKPPTALNTYGKVQWAMANVCGDGSCRGGTFAVTFADSPEIPPGYHILVYLEVSVGPAGTYLIEPRNGIGNPAINNLFAHFQGEESPNLVGCDIVAVAYAVTATCPGAQNKDEGQLVSFVVQGSSTEPLETVNLEMTDDDGTGGNFNATPGQPATGTFTWTPGICDAGVYTLEFRAYTGAGEDFCTVEVTVNNVNQPCEVDAGPDKNLVVPAGGSVTATVSDDDVDICGDPAGDFTSVTIIPPLTDAAVVGGTVTIGSTDPADAGSHEICFYYEDAEGFQCSDCMTVNVQVGADITMKVKKVEAYPGQQHICVPFALTIRNAEICIGGWEILFSFDPTAGTVVGVDPFGCGVDSLWAHDCEEPEPGGWEWIKPLFTDGGYEPEYFNYVIGAHGHSNWVKVVGLMNMDWPQYVTPDICVSDNDILFSVIVDVNPGWDGHEMYFCWQFTDCTDNTFTNSEGTILWGPQYDSRPRWLDNCCYHDNAVVELYPGYPGCCPGFYIKTVDKGDINCDCVAYSVADAVMFINYLVFGSSALSGCPSFEVHCQAADIDGDGYCFTVADLIMLLRIINGYESPLPKAAPTELAVNMSNGVISVDKEIGAARFVFAGEGQVSGQDVMATYRDGRTVVLAYTMDDRAISGELFTITGDVKLETVEAADFYGNPMAAKVTVPVSFALAQNYPNPFNPETKIAFDLAKDCPVTLTVYNVAGEKVATLVNGQMNAGQHEVSWNASSVSSGVYFYTIDAGDYTATRKMVLMK